MGLINPDMSEVVEVGPGNYSVRITDSEVKETRAGDPRAIWKMQIFDCEDSRLNDRTLSCGTMVVGRGAGFLKRLYEAATGEAWEEGCLTDTEQLHGAELDVVVVDGTDQRGNKTGFPEVKSFAPLGTLAKTSGAA